jgi:hypothetical protein
MVGDFETLVSVTSGTEIGINDLQNTIENVNKWRQSEGP